MAAREALASSDLRVSSIEPDTPEAVVVSFDVPEPLREVFGFTQGQYLTLRKEIDGQGIACCVLRRWQ